MKVSRTIKQVLVADLQMMQTAIIDAITVREEGEGIMVADFHMLVVDSTGEIYSFTIKNGDISRRDFSLLTDDVKAVIDRFSDDVEKYNGIDLSQLKGFELMILKAGQEFYQDKDAFIGGGLGELAGIE